MRIISALIFALSLAPFCIGQSGYQALVKDAKTRIKEMDIDQLKTLQSSGEKFTLIDVREDNEWTAGHAAGAMHIGRGVIEREIESKVAQKDAKLVLAGATSLVASPRTSRSPHVSSSAPIAYVNTSGAGRP